MRALVNKMTARAATGLQCFAGRWRAVTGRGFSLLLIVLIGMPGYAEDTIEHEESMVLYEVLVAEHEKALKRLENLRFEYTRKMREFRRIEDKALRVLTTVTGVEESRGAQLYCDVKFTHEFPDGNPRGFEESWARRLVVNDHQVASWNVGSHEAELWELPVPHEAARLVERQFLTLRCPLLIKAYGDDNMTLSEFKNYLERHRNWRVTVEVREEADDVLYVVTQYPNEGQKTPYKRLLLSSRQGFVVREITHFTEGGAVYQKTEVTAKEIAPDLWFPVGYETVGYATEGEGGESDPVNVDYRSDCEVHVVTLTPDEPEHGFGLGALGINDGQTVKVHRNTGKNERQKLFKGELLPPDVYREFAGIDTNR